MFPICIDRFGRQKKKKEKKKERKNNKKTNKVKPRKN